MKIFPPQKYEHDLRQIFKKKRGCLYPNCTAKVILSHTLQKSGCLSLIAEDNHVYQYQITMNILDNLLENHLPSPTKIGINNASTFFGFCNCHDTQLFHEIENCPLVPTTSQINRISFRSLCSELYRKISSAESKSVMKAVELQAKKINENPELVEILQETNKIIEEGVKMGVSILLSAYDRFLSYLQDESTWHLDFLLLKLTEIPEVLCSSYFSPEIDFENNSLQILAREKEASQGVFLNIFVNNGIGYILFSWEKSHKKMEAFVYSLVTQNDIINTTIALMFSYIENHVFNISWWNNLSIIRKKDIFQRVMDMYHLQGFKAPKKYASWNFSAKTSSLQIIKKLKERGITMFE